VSEKLGSWEALLLWMLLAEGGTAYRADLQKKKLLPSDDATPAKALARAGLILREKRPGQGSGLWLEVTDKGWAKAMESFDVALPDSRLGSKVLHGWLTKLQAYMRAGNVALADILGPPPNSGGEEAAKAAVPPAPLDYPTLRDRIRAAYLAVTGGQLNTRALLSDLRPHLPEVPREALDEALKRMHLEDGTTLMSLDNPREITAAVREAAVTFSGEPMHLLWIVR
jgi:hypothetical protein